MKTAILRCCAKCEWISKSEVCPKCDFSASYSARSVHGNNAYNYQYTQKPWLKRKAAELWSKHIAPLNNSKKSKVVSFDWDELE